jgi:hypothetical protein
MFPMLSALLGQEAEAHHASDKAPSPLLLLEMKSRKITAPADLSDAPEWVQPIIAAAMHLHLHVASL